MPMAWVTEAVDVLEQRHDCHRSEGLPKRGFDPATRFPEPAPDQFGLNGFEEGEEDHETVQWAVFPKEAYDTLVTRIDPNFLQFFGHRRAAKADQAQT